MARHNVELPFFLFQFKGCAHVNVTVLTSITLLQAVQRTMTLDSVFPVILLLHPLVLHIAFVSMMTFCISGQQIWGVIATKIELLRATLSWQVLQNDSKILWFLLKIYSFPLKKDHQRFVPQKSEWSMHYNLLTKTRGNLNIPKVVPLVLSTYCHFLVTRCILHMCWKGVLWIHFAQLVLTKK